MKITEPHTEVGNLVLRSQSQGDLESKLALIAAKAQACPAERFNNLMPHVNYDRIGKCMAVMSRTSAPGADGMSVKQAQANVSWLLPPLIEKIHRGKYQAPPVRRVYIPKADGNTRPLGVPEVLDRGLQAAVAQVLGAIYEQDFLPSSFGFRPNVSCHHALATVAHLIKGRGMYHVLEVDIRDFFGSLDHEWLRKFLELRIGDRRILTLIQSWLRAGVLENGKWQVTESGVPQGGSISPCLANIYLHYVLDLWFEKKMKKQYKRGAHLVRYADDFCVFFKTSEDLEDFKILLRARLSQFGLTMAEEKTHTTNLTPNSESRGARRKVSFLGFNIFLMKTRKGNSWKVTFKTEGKRFTRAKKALHTLLQKIMHWEIAQQARRINLVLVGHFNYYGMAGNLEGLRRFHHAAVQLWLRILGKRSQRGSKSWESFESILNEYPLVPCRLKIPYTVLDTYVRL